MLYKYFTEKLTGLQGLSIEKVEENQNTIHIHCKLERKEHKCPCCGKLTNTIHDYREQVIKDIPAFGTTHADYFYGAVPCTRKLTQEEVDSDYERKTGKVIVETFCDHNIDPMHVPGVLCANHGPFTWGKDAAQAVYHAVVLEEVAKMALLTNQINPNTAPAPQYVLDKHYHRKHGSTAYYGQ